jgi:hypothetical protein
MSKSKKSARPEALTLADVQAEKAEGGGRKAKGTPTASFWATYTGHRAAVRVERTEAAIAVGAVEGETEEECQARIARMKEAALADFALSDKLHAMIELPNASNDAVTDD